jgi:hypothetical protein
VRVLEVLQRVHDLMIGRFITAQARAPLLRQDECPTQTSLISILGI